MDDSFCMIVDLCFGVVAVIITGNTDNPFYLAWMLILLGLAAWIIQIICVTPDVLMLIDTLWYAWAIVFLLIANVATVFIMKKER